MSSHAELLQLIKTRLERVRRRQTLKQLALDYIVRSIYLNTENQDYLTIRIKNIQVNEDKDSKLRNDLLKQFLKIKCFNLNGDRHTFFILKRVIMLLLNSNTSKLDFGNLLFFLPINERPIAAQILLMAVTHSAQNVTELDIDNLKFDPLDPGSNTRPLELLGKLKKLHKLLLDDYFKIKFDLLLKICNIDLPNLQILRICLVAPSEHHYIKLGSLGKLRVLENCGQLDMLDDPWGPLFSHFHPRLEYSCCDRRASSIDFDRKSLSRNYLELNQIECKWAPHCDLYRRQHPNVTHLVVDLDKFWSGSDIDDSPLLHFAKVEKLELMNVTNSKVCRRMLRSMWPNLRELYLQSLYLILLCPFRRIFKYCPKLETLHIETETCNTDSVEVLSNFAELKNFKWIVSSCSGMLRKNHLSKMLLAPKLQKIHISGVLCDGISLKIPFIAIRRGRILQELESLHFVFAERNINMRSIHAATDFLRLAAVHLPKLTDLRISVVDNGKLHRDFSSYVSSGIVDQNSEIFIKCQRLLQIAQEFYKHNNISTEKISRL